MKIVLTGAAGRLGSYLREPLAQIADEFVSSDIMEDIGNCLPNERYQKADLANFEEVNALMQGADVVVHFGAMGDEAPFEQILAPNIIGAYNVWETAHQNGVSRVVYASSIHAVGMHPSDGNIGTDAAHRPDTFYGLAKCFSEDLARMYWDKRQLEAVCLRILSCAQVTSPRALGTWLSYDDLIRLVTAAITAKDIGFEIAYGVSANDRAPVGRSNSIGFVAQDNAEIFAEAILSESGNDTSDTVANSMLGGPFSVVELGQSGLATMKIVDDKKSN